MNRRAFLLGALMVFCGNLVAIALKSFAEAKFLAAYGPTRVPWLLVANAVGFAAATIGYDALTRRARAATVDFALLVLLGVAAAAAPAELRAGAPPVVLVVALAAISQVAGLALWNRVAASVAGRDARRMLPRAGAAVTAGGAIAGLGAAPLIPRVGADILPYIGACVCAVALVLAILQDRALTAGGSPGATAPPGTSEHLNTLQRRLLHALILVALLEGVVTTVVDLQFAARLKGRYHGDELASMVALFYGGTNLALLALQATAVPRLLVTRSLPTTKAIHPVMVLLGYIGFLVAPGFGTIAITRTADQVMRLATSRTGQEISLSMLPPGPRARWKVLLRGVLWPAGAASAALVLVKLGPIALAHPLHLAGVAMGIAVVWAITAQRAARRFQAALAAPLGLKATTAVDATQIDLATLEAWSAAAGSDDARTAGLARGALARARVAAADLGDQLRHDDVAVRVALFEQLARAPEKSLRAELRAATLIEEDEHAFAVALKAMAIGGDDAGLARGAARGAISREIEHATAHALVTLRGGANLVDAVVALAATDPQWAITLVRTRGADAPTLPAALIAAATTTSGALTVIAAAGPAATMPILGDALAAGAPAATAALTALDARGAAHFAAHVASLVPTARLAAARALAGALDGRDAVVVLLADPDHEVANAALRTALAIARGGRPLPAEPIAAAYTTALAALAVHLDAREHAAQLTACARHELELATRSCVARLLWAAAVELANAGRDPAALVATARRLVGGRDADRRRALDLVQELQSGKSAALAQLERWLLAAQPADGAPPAALVDALAAHDPWVAQLIRGELAALEPALVALRVPALFATASGPALAQLAAAAQVRELTGTLFAEGAAGESMFVVTRGTLVAQRGASPPRAIPTGGVVGELAVLARAPRAATVSAGDGGARLLEIERAVFTTAAQRAPELVLGLSATLAGWLAANRPDLLG